MLKIYLPDGSFRTIATSSNDTAAAIAFKLSRKLVMDESWMMAQIFEYIPPSLMRRVLDHEILSMIVNSNQLESGKRCFVLKRREKANENTAPFKNEGYLIRYEKQENQEVAKKVWAQLWQDRRTLEIFKGPEEVGGNPLQRIELTRRAVAGYLDITELTFIVKSREDQTKFKAFSLNELEDWMWAISVIMLSMDPEEGIQKKRPLYLGYRLPLYPAPTQYKEGILWKQSQSITKKWQQRKFVLKRDTMLYFKPSLDPVTAHPTGVINLETCIIHMGDAGPKAGKWEFKIATVSREFLLGTNTSEEREDWVNSLISNIENIQGKPSRDAIMKITTTIEDVLSSGGFDLRSHVSECVRKFSELEVNEPAEALDFLKDYLINTRNGVMQHFETPLLLLCQRQAISSMLMPSLFNRVFERQTILPLRNRIFSCFERIQQTSSSSSWNVSSFERKVTELREKPQQLLQALQMPDTGCTWDLAIRLMQRSGEMKMTVEFLEHIVAVANAIHDENVSLRGSNEDVLIAGDDLLSIFIWVVVHGCREPFDIISDFLWMMSDASDLQGTKGYHLTVFSAAVTFIKSLELPDTNRLTIISPKSRDGNKDICPSPNPEPHHTSPMPPPSPSSIPQSSAEANGIADNASSLPPPPSPSSSSSTTPPAASRKGRARATRSTIGGMEAAESTIAALHMTDDERRKTDTKVEYLVDNIQE